MHLSLLLCFQVNSFFFNFQQFYSDVFKYYFPYICSTWGFSSFLNWWLIVFHQFWKILRQYLFKYNLPVLFHLSFGMAYFDHLPCLTSPFYNSLHFPFFLFALICRISFDLFSSSLIIFSVVSDLFLTLYIEYFISEILFLNSRFLLDLILHAFRSLIKSPIFSPISASFPWYFWIYCNFNL